MFRLMKNVAATSLCIALMSAVSSPAKAASPTSSAPATGNHSANFRVSPLGLLVGSVALELDLKVTDGFAGGPTVSIINLSAGDLSVNGTSFGLKGVYYLGRPVYSEGWYVSPFAQYVNISIKDKINGENAEGSATGFGIGGIGGYQWVWDTFNINLGIGAAVSSVSNIRVKTSSGTTEEVNSRAVAGLATEFTIGWLF